ncbi:helix-turn-helix domain-containing protein [Natrialbaceae archaeon A-gly3]
MRETLARHPDVWLTWEQSDITEDGSHKMLVWIESDDFEGLHETLENDPTVRDFSRRTAFNERRLYHIELTEEGHQMSLYPLIIEEGIVLDHVTADGDGWKLRVTFPDHDALERFQSFCTDHDVDVELRRLYEERETEERARYGLTDRQRETLVAAVEEGYLEIPRSCSLAELGEGLGVSSNAASERFRRVV